MEKRHWTRYHWLATACCLLAFAAAGLIAEFVFERVPHVEDEFAYLFQAQVFSTGRATVDSPAHIDCFPMPFIVDHDGHRFGKYPPGWPALLAVGLWMESPWWINAAGAALIVALVFRLAREMNDPLTGAAAAGLAATSPFSLLLSGSTMSHTTCLAFVTAFLWCFWRTCRPAGDRANSPWAILAGLTLGCAFTIRPFTAVAVSAPAWLYALWRLLRHREWRRLCLMALCFAPLAALVFYFNWRWTGDPLLSPYVLVWPFDRLGFGPGRGMGAKGHTIWAGINNVGFSLWLLASHLHGWPLVSLVFVALRLASKPRRFWDFFLAATALSLSLAYGCYWTSSSLFGPRYLYESGSALFILSAAGIVHVAHRVRKRGDRPWRVYRTALALLASVNLCIYLPLQFRRYHGLYGITAKPLNALAQAGLHDALVIVRGSRKWQAYAVPFSLNAPSLDGDVVYARECVPPEQLAALFSGRDVYYFDVQTLQISTGPQK